MGLEIAPRRKRRGNPSEADAEVVVLTRERLEQLAEHHDFAPTPDLAERWSFTPEEVLAVQSIEADAKSDNTDRSYAAAARYWQAWFLLRYRTPLTLPVPPAAVLRFIIDHVAHWPDPARPDFEVYLLPDWIEQQLVELGLKREGAWKPNTIEHRVSVLSSMHDNTRDAQGQPFTNPSRDPYVVKLLKQVRKAHAKHGQIEVRRDAATKDVLQKLLAQRAGDSLRHLRDRAILLVGFNSGGRRRSEIAALTREKLVSDGDGFLWKLGQTKTSDGKDVDIQKPIQGPAAIALKQWLEVSRIESGPVFREIIGLNQLTDRPMSDQAVYRLVKSAAGKANLDGDWGAHSLRSGFMTQAGKDGHSLSEAMRLSDHKSVLVADRYYQTGAASTSPAANLADGIELPTEVPIASLQSGSNKPPAKQRQRSPTRGKARAVDSVIHAPQVPGLPSDQNRKSTRASVHVLPIKEQRAERHDTGLAGSSPDRLYERHPHGAVHLGLEIVLMPSATLKAAAKAEQSARVALDQLIARYAFRVTKRGDRYQFYLMQSLEHDEDEQVHNIVLNVVNVADGAGCDLRLTVRDLDNLRDWDDAGRRWVTSAEPRPMSLAHLRGSSRSPSGVVVPFPVVAKNLVEPECEQIFVLKAVVTDLSPAPWRQLKVKGTTSVSALDVALQCAFGWGYESWYEIHVPAGRLGCFQDGKTVGSGTKLHHLGLRPGDRFAYLCYSIFDGLPWHHQIALERIERAASDAIFCSCTAGAYFTPNEPGARTAEVERKRRKQGLGLQRVVASANKDIEQVVGHGFRYWEGEDT